MIKCLILLAMSTGCNSVPTIAHTGVEISVSRESLPIAMDGAIAGVSVEGNHAGISLASGKAEISIIGDAPSFDIDALALVVEVASEGYGVSVTSAAADISVRSDRIGVLVNSEVPGIDIIAIDSVPSITLNDPVDACVTGPNMDFIATPAGGVFSTNAPAGLTDHGNGTATLDVSAAGSGTWDVTYIVSYCGCCSVAKTVAVEVFAQPTADAGADQTIYSNATAALSANTPTVGTGAWSVVSGPSLSASQFSSITNPSATFTPALAGVYTIAWVVSSAPCPPATDSLVITVNQYTSTFVISGKVIWEGNRLTTMSGVSGVTVTLSGAENQSMVTGLDGIYSFTVSTAGNYTISASKNTSSGAMNGVTAADASRINQHVIGSFPLTDPYKLISADINNSKSITSQDASFISQALIGNPIALGFLQNRTWVFVPKSYVFANPLNPWQGGPPYFPETIILTGVSTNQTGQDFIGTKLGDVNSTANPGI